MYPYRHSGKDPGSERQTEAANGVFEASWPLLGGFGQAFGESWAALWGAFGASWGLLGGFSEVSWRQIPINMNSRGFLSKFGSGLGG